MRQRVQCTGNHPSRRAMYQRLGIVAIEATFVERVSQLNVSEIVSKHGDAEQTININRVVEIDVPSGDHKVAGSLYSRSV